MEIATAIMNKYYGCLALLSLMFTALPSFAAPACELVPPASVETVLGQKIEKKTEFKGALSEACTYTTVAGTHGPSFFVIERYTIDVPKGHEQDLMMRTPANAIVAIPNLGDSATMEKETSELIMRSGSQVYKINARGIACEKAAPGQSVDEEKARCLAKHTGVLIQTAGLLLKPLK